MLEETTIEKNIQIEKLKDKINNLCFSNSDLANNTQSPKLEEDKLKKT
ncbi:8156_t:CDS:2 [Gigaspora margarita]|uniref:8156_t:CDS:1 n=1 Tax=Gigaspora margarita TaxID=4874 RepID=A0ABM8W4A8_GIGMA|nr:8156_t:CDS:2 [Gigaspora margarita]